MARIGPVFADAKLHDIPSQTERAARRLAEYGARWVSAHASGGRKMLEAVAAGLASGARGSPAGALAITVLTSLDPPETAAAFGRTPGELVSRLARMAAETGVEGVVCSPKELGVVAVRMNFGPGSTFQGGGVLDVWHSFKIYGDQIHAAEAYCEIVPTGTKSGWE